jgi:hypothetical protein
MESETETAVRRETGTVDWTTAVFAGLGAGIVMGLMIQFVMGIMPVIGALYGAEGLVTGWVAHLVHSVVFALVFAAAVSRPPLSKYAESPVSAAGLGLVYGVLLWVVAAAIVMPIWMGAVGLPSPGVPNLNPQSLVGHVVFGVLLGGLYAVLSR